ncbi:probable serine/threonine-protein kinase DDB_G0280133 isoform X2 [Chrysoperla carnea]|uniref:probable serine/threonine-protein kinase DDB_G0280133 isoform X2 n=1 Tax=Chrysoperla carnea TaxID=189513 RepID=UPI001D090778|nr:probable serine/threonine-protein kinase DDB_G0280133 isoform X2 [Chrysoperla carnea]
MWFENQTQSHTNCAMMGIQATAGKRKLDAVVASGGVAASSNCEDSTTTIPAKAGRWADNTTSNNNITSTPSLVINSNSNNNSLTSSTSLTTSTSSPMTLTTTITTPSNVPPPPATTDDCIARLRAVAVPGEISNNNLASSPSTTTSHNGLSSNSSLTSNSNSWQTNGIASSTSATTLLSEDLDDDDIDDYDDFSDDDRCSDLPYSSATPQGYQPARYPDFSQYQSQRQQGYYHTDDPFQTQYLNRQPNHHRGAPGGYWNNYYNQPQQQPHQPQQAQQTIRCDENGKSYLELGSAPPPIQPTQSRQIPPPPPPPPIRCCDGPTRWCNYPCYRQRRLAVLNLSMFKLARYRQCSDPSLHRSVLICNTLRLIEREMEAEGNQIAAYQAQQQQAQQQQQAHQHQQQMEAESAASSYTSNQTFNEYSNRLTPVMDSSSVSTSYEHNLRELNASGRATPFPSQTVDTDSGLGDEDTSRSINWSSVLSLTSQTDLDPLNNNELYQTIEPTSTNGPTVVTADVDMSQHHHNTSNSSTSSPTLSSSTTTLLSSSSSSSQLMDEFLPSWNKNNNSSNSASSCSVDDHSVGLRTEQYNNRFPGEGEWDSFMQVLVGGS